MDFILHPDLTAIIQTAGYLGIFLIIAAESGMFIGFFLPGDTLLFTAGILAATGYLNLYALVAIVAAGAILGDQVGYAIGRKYGPKIFKREESFWFKKERVEQAAVFFEKYGKKTVVFARFVPIVRTFIPVVAGVGKMDYADFLKYNILGGILWGGSVTLLGYFLGEVIPNIDSYLLPLIGLIVVISVLPGVISFFHARMKHNHD